MKRLSTHLSAILLLGASLSLAAVAPGENLALNGAFEAEQLDFPQFWGISSPEFVKYSPTAGPEASGAVRFVNLESEINSANVRQHGLKLVAGETYKVSAWVKTVNFKSAFNGVIIHNQGWYSSQGVMRLPENSDGWQHFENTFKLAKSENGTYGIALLAKDFTGELSLARVRLEAVSAGALAGSSISPAMIEMTRPRLVPWSPLLNKIPLTHPRMTYRLFGRIAEKGGDVGYEACFKVDGQEIYRDKLKGGTIELDLKSVAAGDHTLEGCIFNSGTGESVFAITNTITLVALPAVDVGAHRRMNNLVTEVLHQELVAQSATQELRFSTARDGWAFISIKSVPLDDKVVLELDGVLINPTLREGALEVFHHLGMGEHTLAVREAANGGVACVRAIAEIFNYPACANSQVPQNGRYDWEFFEKYVFPAVTTLNGGSVPDAHLPELRKRGLRWLANLGTTNPRDATDLLARLQKSAGLREEKYDGVTCDEQFFSNPTITYYTDALRAYENSNNRLIYSWIVGKPTISGIHNEFISAALNASRGAGRMLYEAYCHSRPSEEDARNYLRGRIVETMQSFLHYYPEATPGTGIILGNFNQIPVISLDVNPEVDYKYYLDMQLHLVANHTVFKDLGVVGYWGSYYDDEELYRWSFKLLRHYCVEGNSEMLSHKYGYKYNPGCLQNCDFLDGLKHWQVREAAPEAITTTKFAGYGKLSQERWGAAQGTGDTFCLFKRKDGAPNTITQQAKGLVPGRTYSLQFITADYKAMVEKTPNPRQYGVTVTLGEGAMVMPESSWVFVDKRTPKKGKEDKARVNLHHVRFKAAAESVTITFSDATAVPGEELALNYIMLKPYFEE